MTRTTDSLYELLPELYRQKDAGNEFVLKALMGVIGEQVRVVEDDIADLYENWFIETCDDWVVPYIGDLVGWRQVHEAGEPVDPVNQRARQLNKVLIPRREVANTIRYRRRKGTIALLELLAGDVAGWPARAVEFFRLTAFLQSVKHVRLDRGRTVDLHDAEVLERLAGARGGVSEVYAPLASGPFDEIAHTVDVRRINSTRTPGRYNLPNVGLFVWRLKPYAVTKTDAFFNEDEKGFTFSPLGDSVPLFSLPIPEASPHDLAGPRNVSEPIRRRAFEKSVEEYYGPGKSLQIFADYQELGVTEPVPVENIVSADLTDWRYRSDTNRVAVDPQLGRVVFPEGTNPSLPSSVRVSYHYGFSMELGGGQYERRTDEPGEAHRYRVFMEAENDKNEFSSLVAAILQWQADDHCHAVIEIQDSRLYDELLWVRENSKAPLKKVEIRLREGQDLQIRAASGRRPIVSIYNKKPHPDSLDVHCGPSSRFTLDGICMEGCELKFHSNGDDTVAPRNQPQITVRHCTLFRVWPPNDKQEAGSRHEPSIEIRNLSAGIKIDKSILGAIRIDKEEAESDPVALQVADCILDAGHDCTPVVSGDGCAAHVDLDVRRTTVVGGVHVHAIELAENSIFLGHVHAQRQQAGCVRFCYVPEGSKTPRRYRCQPDLVEQAVDSCQLALQQTSSQPAPAPETPTACREFGSLTEPLTQEEQDQLKQRERHRVQPVFNSLRYGAPDYCQLAPSCPAEIRRGADDESEMGVFHDLYQPQRAANLQARLEEFAPIDTNVAIIYAT